MTLVLNDEQIQLKDAARKFMQQRSPVSALRKLRDEAGPDGIDRQLWQEMVELGWAGILIEEDFGGSGLTPLWMGLIAEECGRSLCASPLLSTAVLSASLIQQLGSSQQKEELLNAIASGKLLCALAIDEGAHHQPDKIQCSVVANGDAYILDGEKTFVIDGHIADKLLVVARSDKGSGVFIVDREQAGLRVTRTHMVDFHNAANIQLEGVKVGKDALLGELGQAQSALENTLNIATAIISAETLGASLEAFERIVDYLKTRVQFDVLIGSFQALQHRAADMFSELELSKSVVLKALNALEEQEESAGRYASMSKALMSDTAQLISNEGIQMFGGIGMTDEEDIGFFLKRIRVLNQSFGNSSYHKKRYADLSGF